SRRVALGSLAVRHVGRTCSSYCSTSDLIPMSEFGSRLEELVYSSGAPLRECTNKGKLDTRQRRRSICASSWARRSSGRRRPGVRSEALRGDERLDSATTP